MIISTQIVAILLAGKPKLPGLAQIVNMSAYIFFLHEYAQRKSELCKSNFPAFSDVYSMSSEVFVEACRQKHVQVFLVVCKQY